MDVQFHFVQAKTSPGFSAADIGTFVAGVRDFFGQSVPLAANREVQDRHDIKEYIYDASVDMDQSPVCYLHYATTGTWKHDPLLNERVEQGKRDLADTGLFSEVHFLPVDAERLKRLHQELHRKITREVNFDKHTILPPVEGVQEAYIGILPCQKYPKLLLNDDDVLDRRLFYDNVRDFQGRNAVNQEIERTLRNAVTKDRFALLNNGVTVVAGDVNKVGARFKLRDYQIVNGCQTSHILYLNRRELTEQVHLPLKLIVTSDISIVNEVTQGTNRQTEVKIEAFESLSPFHKHLEELYPALARAHGVTLYYERRSKQYEHLGVQRERVVTMPTQVKCFVAIFLDEPHSTHRYYGELLSSYRQRLFRESHNGLPYVVSGASYAALEKAFVSGDLPRHWRSLRYHILLAFRLLNEPSPLPGLESKKVEEYCETFLEILQEPDSCLRTLRVAGELVESTRAAFSDEGYPERTRRFTDSIAEAASTGQVPNLAASRTAGEIKVFYPDRGWGFIAGDDGVDYFVHVSDLQGVELRELYSGVRVEFSASEGAKGLKALGVVLASGAK